MANSPGGASKLEKGLLIRITDELREQLKSLCKKQGLTYSDWIRRKIEEDANAEQTKRELEELQAERDRLIKELETLRARMSQMISREEAEALRIEVERLKMVIDELEREAEGAIPISSKDRVILSYVFEQYKALMPEQYGGPNGFGKWVLHSVWAFHRGLGYVLGINLGPYSEIATPLDEALSKALRVSEKNIKGLLAQCEKHEFEVLNILEGVLTGRLEIVEAGKLESGRRMDTDKFTSISSKICQ